MSLVTACVATPNAAKYMRQLCKHWSHKLDVELADGTGMVRFPTAVATMKVGADTLLVTIEADEEQTLERMKEVVASHLERFAFREAPLHFVWSSDTPKISMQ